MTTAIKITAEPRTSEVGTADANRLRRNGFFPGVVYGAGKDVQLVKVNAHAFAKGLKGHAAEHVMLDLEIQGQPVKKVLLQEVQHHPISGAILHADFHEVSMTETLVVEVTVEPTGTPVGVSQQGGLLELSHRTVEIECLPGDLMEVIHVDVSHLNIGDSLTAGDLSLDATKFTVVTDPEITLVSVSAPRLEESSGGEGTEQTGEPEVISEKKSDGVDAS